MEPACLCPLVGRVLMLGLLEGCRWVALILGLLFFLLVIQLLWRRRRLSSGRGAFDCYLRLAGSRSGTWRMGIARYRRHVLAWFPVVGLTFKPAYEIKRLHLQVGPPRWPSTAEQAQLYQGQKIVRVQPDNAGPYELGLAPAALNGLMAWVEAAPPGEGQYGNTQAPGGGSAPERTGRVPKIPVDPEII